jgi:hypothetical protein
MPAPTVAAAPAVTDPVTLTGVGTVAAQPVNLYTLNVPNPITTGFDAGKLFDVSAVDIDGYLGGDTPVLDSNGNPIINPATGTPYTVTTPNYYTFAGTAGQDMSFQVMSASITSIKDPVDTTLTIFGPNGQEVAYNDDQFEPSDSSIFDLSLPSTGTYTVEVDSFHTADPSANDPSAQNYNPAAYYHALHGAYELFMYTFSAFNAVQPPSLTSSTTATLVLPTAPAGSTETVYLNGVAVATVPAGTSSYTVKNVPAGSNTLTVKTSDNSSTSYNVTVDTTPPTVAIDSNPPAQTTATTATFTFSGSDAVTLSSQLVFLASLDGARFSTVTDPATLTNLSVGSHTLEVEAEDQAGNVSQPVSTTWTVEPTISTTTAVKSSALDNTLVYGQQLNLTASIAQITLSPDSPTGEVDFYEGTTKIGSAALTSGQNQASILVMLPAGSYTITATYEGDGTDLTSTSAAYPLTVTPAPLTITVNNQSQTYGAALPALTVTYTGLVNGDTPATFATPANRGPTLTTVPAGSHVGSYAITAAGAVDPDYTITYVGGTLTISPATLDVTASVNTKTYGQTAIDVGSFGGVLSGDGITFSFSSAGDGPTADVGSYPISYTVSDPQAKLSNYTIVYTGANLVVGQATLQVTASANTKTYGQTASDTGSVSGIQNHDALTFSFSSAGDGPTADVGSYPISYSESGSATKEGDYSIVYTGANLVVGQATLQVTANPETKTVGAADPVLTYQVTSGSLATGDSFTGALTRTAGETVGSYPILQGTLTAGSNYTLTFVGSALFITSTGSPLVGGKSVPVSSVGGSASSPATVGSSGAPQLTATGSAFDGTLTATQYQSSPATGFATSGSYFEIYVNSGDIGAGSSVTATFQGLTPNASLFWWNGSQWTPVLNATGQAVVANASGVATVTLTSATSPTVGNLQGVYFLSGVVQPTFSNLTAPQTITYGTASVTVGGTLAAGSLPATGSVTVALNGVQKSATLGANGSFSTAFNTAALAASPTAYAVSYSYTATTEFAAASNSTTTTVTVGIASGSAYILNPSTSGAVNASDSADIAFAGGLFVDSSSPTAVQASGTAQVQVGEVLDIVGGVSTSGSARATRTGAPPATGDPYATLPLPSVAGLANHGPANVSGGVTALPPGIYTSITVSGSGQATLTTGGTYIIKGGGLTVSGTASLTGTNVFIFNAGSNYNGTTDGGTYGGVTLSGSGTISLSPMSSGPYAGVVLFQSRSNTRGLIVSGSAGGAISGVLYAPSAAASLSVSAMLKGALVAATLTVSGGAGAFQLTDASDATYDASTANWVTDPVLTVAVEDDTRAGLDPAEVADLGAAMSYLNQALAPFGVDLSWSTTGTAADVTVHFATTTPEGGADDGILGYTTPSNAVYIVVGWNYYTGSDPSGIAADQYDFTTLAIHELAHSVGLGESQDPNSVMYEYLAPGTVRRSFTDANLTAINTDADRFMKVAGAPATATSAPAIAVGSAAPTLLVARPASPPTSTSALALAAPRPPTAEDAAPAAVVSLVPVADGRSSGVLAPTPAPAAAPARAAHALDPFRFQLPASRTRAVSLADGEGSQPLDRRGARPVGGWAEPTAPGARDFGREAPGPGPDPLADVLSASLEEQDADLTALACLMLGASFAATAARRRADDADVSTEEPTFEEGACR